MVCLSKFLSEHYEKLSETYVGRTPPPKRLKQLKLLVPLVYNRLILFLRRIYEKGSFVAWFGSCIDDDAKTAIVIVRRRDAKSAAITLVCSWGHIIGASRSHDLHEAILADQGAPADHSEILARRTNWIQLVWLNSVGLTHRPIEYHNTRPFCHAALWITRKPEPTYERFSQFAPYSYVKSHLGNDSCLPIYKTNPAICNTPHQTHCVGNSIFPHFVMVMTVLWAKLWFVVECRALFFT
jgi:hypothetical protein